MEHSTFLAVAFDVDETMISTGGAGARAHLNQYFSFGGFGSDSKDRGELTRIAIGRASVVLGVALDPAHVCVLGGNSRDSASS